MSRAHFWDITAISALDKVVPKFRREGTEVEVIGLNEASATMVDKFGVTDKGRRRRRAAGPLRRTHMNIDRKILACVDNTPMAEVVTDYASWAARRLDAPVELLHVLERHVEALPRSGPQRLDRPRRPGETHGPAHPGGCRAHPQRPQRARPRLLSVLRERAIRGGAAIVDSRLRHGDIEETLAEQQEGSRLLIIGRNARPKPDARAGLGKTPGWVVRSATRPVLLVTEAFREPKRVLFAFDGSSVTRKGVDMLAASPLLRGLQLQLLTAGESGTAGQPGHSTLRFRHCRPAASKPAPAFGPAHRKEVIAGALAEGGIDMLVMGAYSHSPLRNLFGSKTTEMLKATCVPTLLLR